MYLSYIQVYFLLVVLLRAIQHTFLTELHGFGVATQCHERKVTRELVSKEVSMEIPGKLTAGTSRNASRSGWD
jgi:hypothetical protein